MKRVFQGVVFLVAILVFPAAQPIEGVQGTSGNEGEGMAYRKDGVRGVEESNQAAAGSGLEAKQDERSGSGPGNWSDSVSGSGPEKAMIIREEVQEVREFRRGDILVKANHNWLPGSAQVWGGKGFGHAALVLEDTRDTSLARLLAKTLLFESHSRDVPDAFQLRQVAAYLPGDDFRYANITFGPHNQGYCFRLRPHLTPEETDRLIAFVTSLDDGRSSWRAQKRFASPSAQPLQVKGEDPGHWYCSLVIWQAFYTLFGIDLDPNEGVMVYPNDLIASPYFDNSGENKQKRVRF